MTDRLLVERGLFAEGDELSLAEKLIQLLRDDVLVTTMSLAARQFVLNKFDLKRRTQELEALYDRLTGIGGQSASMSAPQQRARWSIATGNGD